MLPYLFDALDRQVFAAHRLELIVVDNSSTDQTESVVNRWKAALPFAVSYYRKENRGPAASRNYGVARARGELLAFTDSDCVPDPNWLREAVAAFTPDVGVVCGPVVPRFRLDGPGLISAQIGNFTKDRGIYPTANLLIRTQAFRQTAGFDERFALYPWGAVVGGEDTELAWRLKRMGFRAAFAAAATVGHLSTPEPIVTWLLRPVSLQILPRLLPTIPELRQTSLWRGYFVDRLHLFFQLAWMGSLVAFLTATPLFALASLPWLIGIRRGVVDRLKQGRLIHAGVAFALITEQYAVATLALVYASLRHRSLVL